MGGRCFKIAIVKSDWVAGGWKIAGKKFWDGSASHRGRPPKSRFATSCRRRAAQVLRRVARGRGVLADGFSPTVPNRFDSAQVSRPAAQPAFKNAEAKDCHDRLRDRRNAPDLERPADDLANVALRAEFRSGVFPAVAIFVVPLRRRQENQKKNLRICRLCHGAEDSAGWGVAANR